MNRRDATKEADPSPAKSYLLRNIPSDLWDRAKHRAVDEKCSLRDLVLGALREKLAGG